jgi:hypothetical protein
MFNTNAFMFTNLVFEACDIFFPSRATPSLIVTNTFLICRLFLNLSIQAISRDGKINRTLPIEVALLSLILVLGFGSVNDGWSEGMLLRIYVLLLLVNKKKKGHWLFDLRWCGNKRSRIRSGNDVRRQSAKIGRLRSGLHPV